jgi:hypothetical protein
MHLLDVDECSLDPARKGMYGILLTQKFKSVSPTERLCARCNCEIALSAIWIPQELEIAMGDNFSYPFRQIVKDGCVAGRESDMNDVISVDWHSRLSVGSALYTPPLAILPVSKAAYARHHAAEYRAKLDTILGQCSSAQQLLERLEETFELDGIMGAVAPPADRHVASTRTFLYLVARTLPPVVPLTLRGGNYWLIVRNVRLAFSWRGGYSHTLYMFTTSSGGGGNHEAPDFRVQEDAGEQLTLVTVGAQWALLYVPATVGGDCQIAVLESDHHGSKGDGGPRPGMPPPLLYYRGSREAVDFSGRSGKDDDDVRHRQIASLTSDDQTSVVRLASSEDGDNFVAYRPAYQATTFETNLESPEMMRKLGIGMSPLTSFFGWLAMTVDPTARNHMQHIVFRPMEEVFQAVLCLPGKREQRGILFNVMVQAGSGGRPTDFVLMFDEHHVYRLLLRSPDDPRTEKSPAMGLRRGWVLDEYAALDGRLMDKIVNVVTFSEQPMVDLGRLFKGQWVPPGELLARVMCEEKKEMEVIHPPHPVEEEPKELKETDDEDHMQLD